MDGKRDLNGKKGGERGKKGECRERVKFLFFLISYLMFYIFR